MADDRLRNLVYRIERLLEERRGITDDIRDVYNEAKAVGYSASIIRRLIQRRAMKPEDRVEADEMLGVYEADLAGGEEAKPVGPDERAARAAELAHAILAEQIAGLEDRAQAALLVEHVTVILDIRAEIAVLRDQEAARRKLAKSEGFLVPQLSQVVRWIEKCAKHGTEAMRAGEALFLTYRGTVEAARNAADPANATNDSVLAAKFAKPAPKKANARSRRLAETFAWCGLTEK